MADLAAKITIETRPRAGRDAFRIRDGVTLYEGALVGIDNATGLLEHWADGANDVFMGIMIGGHSRANDGVIIGETSDSDPPEGYVDTSGVILRNLSSVSGQAALTVANVGDLVYCATSNIDDMTLIPTGHQHPIGWLIRFRSTTDVDVQLFTPAEHLAQATA